MSHTTIDASDVGVTLKCSEKPLQAEMPAYCPDDFIVLITTTDPGRDLEQTINDAIGRQKRQHRRYLVRCDVGRTRHCFATLHFRDYRPPAINQFG